MAGKKSQYALLLAVLIAVGVIILTVGVVIWQRQGEESEGLRQQRDSLNNEYKQAKIETDALPRRKQDLAEVNARLSDLDLNLVDYKYIPTYLKQIEDKAKATGNTLRSIHPTAPRPLDLHKSPLTVKKVADAPAEAPSSAPASPYYVQQISLDIEGSYVDLLKFLEALRAFPKMIYVRTVNITPVTGNGNSVVRMNTHLETYAIIIPDQYKSSPDENAPKEGKR